ncbi:vacuolar protein-sorting-associated protein 25 [Cimex lectularius]|uniref:Vacuolar protein-sorting-associated protein 25 n=1 Tax=Cimex lectularius TaxID=79782 RepID=A0A8I6RMV8_CIMLE|nr:vacuolar protein-sorting-associated protein 25 [Cimex lectularius]
MGTYEDWPWQYNFPPFFTIQPNLTTRKLQLSAWCDLVLKYHRYQNQYVLDMREAQGSPLFSNKTLKRTLPAEGIAQVLASLQASSNAEPLDKSKNRWYIYWHTLDEWAALIYGWAEETGQLGAVCTFYEIANVPDQEFFGIDTEVLKKALKVLESKKKAEIISFEDNNGVKFF